MLLQDNFVELFGASRSQTAQLSKQVQQNIPQTNNTSHVKLSQSLSSLSSTSSTGGTIKISKPDKQCEVTNKLLSSTINVSCLIIFLCDKSSSNDLPFFLNRWNQS